MTTPDVTTVEPELAELRAEVVRVRRLLGASRKATRKALRQRQDARTELASAVQLVMACVGDPDTGLMPHAEQIRRLRADIDEQAAAAAALQHAHGELGADAEVARVRLMELVSGDWTVTPSLDVLTDYALRFFQSEQAEVRQLRDELSAGRPRSAAVPPNAVELVEKMLVGLAQRVDEEDMVLVRTGETARALLDLARPWAAGSDAEVEDPDLVRFRETLAALYIHLHWLPVTNLLTTGQREAWADACDHYVDSKVDRWWRTLGAASKLADHPFVLDDLCKDCGRRRSAHSGERFTVAWAADAVRDAVEQAVVVLKELGSEGSIRVGSERLSWMDLACLVDVGRALLAQDEPEVEPDTAEPAADGALS